MSEFDKELSPEESSLSKNAEKGSEEDTPLSKQEPKTPPKEKEVLAKSPVSKIIALVVVCVVVLGLSIGSLVSALGTGTQEQAQNKVQGVQGSSSTTLDSPENAGGSDASGAGADGETIERYEAEGVGGLGQGNTAQSGRPAEQTLQTIKVTVKISCFDAVAAGSATAAAVSNGGAMYDVAVTLDAGSTAYHALEASGAIIGSSTAGGMGAYVYSIDGLAEKDVGNESGWVYFINGAKVSYASSNYTLSDGDIVEWRYALQA